MCGCGEHAKGKSCLHVIAEGNCLKEKCHLFNKVLNVLPKLKKLHELEAQGVDLTTIWDFSEKGTKIREKRKKKAEKWLKEFYPKIKQNLQGYFIEG
jgi:coproporphyrinogen III oxidase